jgi:hypothetical protein
MESQLELLCGRVFAFEPQWAPNLQLVLPPSLALPPPHPGTLRGLMSDPLFVEDGE